VNALSLFLLYPYVWQALLSSLFTLGLVWILIRLLSIRDLGVKASLFVLPLLVPLLLPFRGPNGRLEWQPLLALQTHLSLHSSGAQGQLLMLACFLPLTVTLVQGLMAYVAYRAVLRRGRLVTASEEPRLFELLATLTRRTGTPVPEVYLLPPDRGVQVFVAGTWRPRLVLSSPLVTSLPPEELEAVLAHEMAHLARHDQVVSWAVLLMRSLMFYNPVLYVLTRWLRREREKAADLLASSWTGRPWALASGLLHVTRLLSGRQPESVLLPGLTSGRILSDRVQLLLSDGEKRERQPYQLLAFAVAFVALEAAFYIFALMPLLSRLSCPMLHRL
jgi:Zn-dependent protease with chaperone function